MKKELFMILALLLITDVAANGYLDMPSSASVKNYETIKYIILFLGFAVGFILYEYFTFRAGGVIAVPLLVVYTMTSLNLFFMVMIFAALIWGTLELIFNTWHIYGRRLLYVSALISIVLTVPFILTSKTEASIFLSLVPGLFAYNFHRENNSSANIMASIMLTVAYAAILMGVALIFVLI